MAATRRVVSQRGGGGGWRRGASAAAVFSRKRSRGLLELLSAGSQRCQDDSPLIHLASGSWVWNSALNRSSTVSLVSLPGWLSTAGAKTERNKQAVNRPRVATIRTVKGYFCSYLLMVFDTVIHNSVKYTQNWKIIKAQAEKHIVFDRKNSKRSSSKPGRLEHFSMNSPQFPTIMKRLKEKIKATVMAINKKCIN